MKCPILPKFTKVYTDLWKGQQENYSSFHNNMISLIWAASLSRGGFRHSVSQLVSQSSGHLDSQSVSQLVSQSVIWLASQSVCK